MLQLPTTDRMRRGIARGLLLVLLSTPFWMAPLPARAEYRVQVGDVLDIFVSGVPDLQRKVVVGVDGRITLPWVGWVEVKGLALPALRTRLQEAVLTKAIRHRAMDGRETVVFLNSEEISVDVAEFGPIYLTGDVAKAGELKYRPGMTVHQAIALAGGTDLARFRTSNPFIQSADLRGEYEALSAELTKEQIRLWRLQAELDGTPLIETHPTPGVRAIPANVTMMQSLELDQYKTRNADFQKERSYLDRALKKTENHLSLLNEQRKREEEGSALDHRELESIQTLFQKGMVPSSRMTDARRSVLIFTTRLLQTTVQIAQVGREQEETARKIEKLEDTRRIELLREIQDCNVRISVLRAKLNSVSEKLLYTGTSQVMLTGGKGARPEITISRKANGGWQQFPGNLESDLQPGDVVEIFLKPETIDGIAAAR